MILLTTVRLHARRARLSEFLSSYADEKNRNTLKRVTVGHSAILTCKLKNISDPSKVILGYSWTKSKVDVTVDSRFTVLMWGGLFIRHTRVEDAGTYKCTAKTLSHEDVPKVYRGEEIKLDILCKLYTYKIFLIQSRQKRQVNTLSDHACMQTVCIKIWKCTQTFKI